MIRGAAEAAIAILLATGPPAIYLASTPPGGAAMFLRRYVVTCLAAAAIAAPVGAQPAPAKEAPRTDAYGDPLPTGALARLGPARLRAQAISPPVALSQDAKLLAFSPDRLDVTIADAATGKALRTFKAGYVNGETLA